MTPPRTDGFDAAWERPEDARVSWLFDREHSPDPLVPMEQALARAWVRTAFGQRLVVANGYLYMNADHGMPTLPANERGRSSADLWNRVYLPLTTALVRGIRDRDFGAMATPTLAASIDDLFEQSAAAFRNTMVVVMGMSPGTDRLLRFSADHLGDEDGALAATMLQGLENATGGAGAALGELADLAGRSPELGAAIRAGRYDEISDSPDGPRFDAAFESLLDSYGWRAGGWNDLRVPTWAEQPEEPLRLIASYLDDPARSPSAARRRAAEQRVRARARAEGRLEGDASREELRALLLEAEEYIPMKEGRALWQLMAVGVLRGPLMELGRRFVAAGALRAADAVLYLFPPETVELAGGALADAGELASSRRADHEHWSTLSPPRYLGESPVGLDDEPEAPAHSAVIEGMGASQGIARGRARVIRSLADQGRLEAGDVLVCQSTAPSWTGLFARAGAVVTDTGGILSHSAIVAREYAIPAVVGVRGATERIPDGAMVTVDGGVGTVTIEEPRPPTAG